MREIEDALKSMKHKAPGPDEVTMDMVRAEGTVGIHWLCRIFRSVWEEKCFTEEWRKVQIVPIFKYGNRKQCKNYIGGTNG